MVKVWCGICRTVFETLPNELWVCPNCEEAGNVIFDVTSVSNNEIENSWELLQKPDGKKRAINEIIGSDCYAFFGEYHNEQNINDLINPLILLYDKVIVKDKLLTTFRDKFDKLGHFENYLDEKWVAPITGFSPHPIHFSDNFGKYCINHFEILNHSVWENLKKNLAGEYLRHIKENHDVGNFIKNVTQREMPDTPYPLQTFQMLLDFHFADQIMISQLNCPSYLQLYQTDVTNFYFKDLMKLKTKDIGKEVRVLQQFIEKLSINIPLNVEFDDLKQFRNDKTAIEFRAALFDITDKNRSANDKDIVNDLIWCFNERLQEFNEAVESFSHYRTGLMTGMVSTIGGLLGGGEGALIGGLGGTSSMFIGDYIFKKYYIRNHKDWAYFLWKWKHIK